MSDEVERLAMERALQLAEFGRYTVRGNPMVGCVLLRDGAIVGEGFHVRPGEAHAEIHALRTAGARARGATAVVTLEPCNHTGRTGPCAEALIEAGVARVVSAVEDPNPLVAGSGHARLRAAGIDVEVGLERTAAERLNRGFFRRMRNGRPWVTAKMALSLDGRTALADGRSQWITGPMARARVQWLRAESGALLTGSGTVLADDPRLTVRLPADPVTEAFPERIAACMTLGRPPYDGRQPLRVVVDRRHRTEAEHQVYAGDGQSSRWPERQGGEADLAGLLAMLAQRYEVSRLLVEAGPTLLGALLEADLIDQLELHYAPLLLGSQARPLAALARPIADLTTASRWRRVHVLELDNDLALVFERQP